MVAVCLADMVANNIAFMLNLADWMVQDEALINIRSKVLRVNTFEPLESTTLLQYRVFNLFGGSILLDLSDYDGCGDVGSEASHEILIENCCLSVTVGDPAGRDYIGWFSESIIVYCLTRDRFDYENGHF